MMKTLYFDRDQERGQIGTYNWLRDEIEELGERAIDEWILNRKQSLIEFSFACLYFEDNT